MNRDRWIMLAVAAVVPLFGCKDAATEPKHAGAAEHAKLDAASPQRVAIAGQAAPDATTMVGRDAAATDIRRITLSETAAKRLGIAFSEVSRNGERFEMPYKALLYDTSGHEWVFMSPSPNVFVRTALKVDAIEGDKVLYTAGPSAGTRLVTEGAAELYGIEFGVGK